MIQYSSPDLLICQFLLQLFFIVDIHCIQFFDFHCIKVHSICWHYNLLPLVVVVEG
jgi:hypothetical protein